MRNRDRSVVASVGRALLVVAGIIGAFATVDAVVLFSHFPTPFGFNEALQASFIPS